MKFKKIILLISLISLLILSGCINIDVEQKLKRNGNYDIDLVLSTSSEYKMILNGFKDSVQVDDSVKNKFEYKETDTSLIYSFKDINPLVDSVLFKKVENKSNNDQGDMFGQSGGADVSFLSPNNVIIDKEFKFPYYTYTYKLIINPDSSDDSSKNETLLINDYILDNAGILSPELENELIQSINNIYKNDSIELIVFTDNQISSSDYFSFRNQFTTDFNFKSDKEQYILVFVSTADQGVCKIQSNIFLDSKTSLKISNLNRNFSSNCGPNYDVQIKDLVTELDDYYKINDLNTSTLDQMTEQMNELFKIAYKVTVFGSVVETDGVKLTKNKVKFEVDPSKKAEYNIVFKDFFLATALGGSYIVFVIIFCVIVIGGLGYLVFSKIKKKQQSEPIQVPNAANPTLLDYVRKARNSGLNDMQIRDNLIKSGWNSRDIDLALRS